MRHPLHSLRSGRPLTVLSVLLVAGAMLAVPVAAEPAGTASAGAAANAPADPDPGEGDKVESELAASLDDKGSADFYVDFTEHADLSAAAKIDDWAERGAAVVTALQTAADSSQADLRSQLDAAEVDYTSFWISNTILVRGGSQALADSAAALQEVQALRAPETFDIPEAPIGSEQPTVNAVEWGIDRIQADDVWSTFGVRGEGIVVANIDSGVNVEHPALARQYRGLAGGQISHDYSWFDPSDVCGTPAPCDNNNHGTHTMGTMVGDDRAGNQIGVAPRARWIAAKGCETNSCSETALLASGQWMLAPTRIDGTDPDPAKRPNIINNSWGGAAGRTWYSDTIDAWRAAGIFPAFSNGNSGPACGTASSPGNDEQAFSSGAFDVTNTIASFSSRGTPDGAIKPNLAAPGVNVRSSVANGGYATLSGTSMASPHTAGTVALMWSAAPSLVGDISGTTDILNRTAADTADLTCGGTDANNNVWGEGKLDALAAVTASPTVPTGTLTGVVTAVTGEPLDGATVTVSGPVERDTDTGADGSYSLPVPAGDYTVSASVFGYDPQTAAVTVTDSGTVVQDFALPVLPTATVSGTVSTTEGPVADATVTIDGTPVPPSTTGPDGTFSMPAVPFGTYRLTATGGGCHSPATSDLVVDGDRTLTVTLAQRSDSFGYTCLVEESAYPLADTPLALVGDDRTASVDLPFPFLFYGSEYTKAWVSTNGHLNFLASVTALANARIPSPGIPNAAIYPFWDDLNVVAGTAQVLTGTAGIAPNRSFLIEWRNVSFYREAALQIDVLAQLNEDGSIVTRYRNLGPDPRERGSSATVGIENSDGTVGLQYSSNTAVLADTASVRFTPPATGFVTGVISDGNDQGPITGATVRALQGAATAATTTTGADGSYSLRLRLGTYSLDAAATNYETAAVTATLATNGETVSRDLSLATAIAALSPPALSFLGTADQLRTTRIALANTSSSGARMTYSITDGQGWMWTVPATGTVPAGGTATLTVRVDATGVPPGMTSGAISITTNSGRQPVLQLPVALTVPAYRQGINAGGGAHLDAAGDRWAADQLWTPGGYGAVGAGWTISTRRPIAGTDDDALYQTAREATSGYRFDNLPAGTYLVELDFTEFRRALEPDRRVFDVSINGEQVMTGYDPVAAVGTLTLDHHEFTTTVAENGSVGVDFGARRGKLPPAITAIRITHQPSP